MKAAMINDDYIDLVPGYEYEVERVYSPGYNHIKLKHSPRKYDIHSFEITHNKRVLNHQEAYRQYVCETTMSKFGLKKG